MEIQEELKCLKDDLYQKKNIIEEYEKEIREINHNSKQKISELEMNLSNMTKKVNSLEELTKSLREATKDEKSNKIIINDLECQISVFENKINEMEQSEMNLKRQLHNNKVECSEIKIELEKMQLNAEVYSNSKNADDSKNKTNCLDNLDEETNNLLTGLIQEIEDLKREKSEFQEKALERITEKEMENIELKELFDRAKEEFEEDLNKWMLKANNLTYEVEAESSRKQSSLDDSYGSLTNEKYDELKEINQELKYELEETTNKLEAEKEKLMREMENIENELKERINNLENDITMLKMEYSKIESEKLEIQRQLSNDIDTKNSFYKTIEEYQMKMKIIEENSQRIQEKLKAQIISLKEVVDENEQNSKYLKFQLDKTKEEFINLKETTQKKEYIKDDQYKSTLENKDRQILILNDKLDQINKDYVKVKLDNEINKSMTEKHKYNMIELQETLKSLKESNNRELQKLEEKYKENERKYNCDRNDLIERNTNLEKQVTSIKNNTQNSSQVTKNSTLRIDTLDDIMGEDNEGFLDQEDTEDNTNLKMKIVSLESQIMLYSNQITDLKLEIDTCNKKKEATLNENTKMKANLKETKELYENQITDLQQKSKKLHHERISLKKTSSFGNFGVDSLNPKQIQLLSELNKKINDLKAENKYLSDNNELLTNEKNYANQLRINDVNYYKDELKKAEQIAVNTKIQFATFVFEKEEEVIKLKQLNKKFMDKLGLTFT